MMKFNPPYRPAVAMTGRLLFATSLLSMLSSPAWAQKAESASAPYMGWSSWSLMRKEPSEAKIKAQANALVHAKLNEFGYRYINVDDYWSDHFDDQGYPEPDPKLFPSGMKALADYLHQRGLKFGIYLNPGISKKVWQADPPIQGTNLHIRDITDIGQEGNTRGGSYKLDLSHPEAKLYLQHFASLLAAWGVDYIKMDFVGPGGGRTQSNNIEEIQQWQGALRKTGRPIWIELSNKMSLEHAADWRAASNGWRIEGDIECYSCTDGSLTRWSNVVRRFTDLPPWTSVSGPGGWNDLDTIELGNGDHDGLTVAERKSMFTLWAIACAPLYLGTDLTKMDPADLELLTNREVIALDQAGRPAHLIPQAEPGNKSYQTWLAHNADGSYTLAVFNLGENAATIALDFKALGLPRNATIRDLWKAQYLSATTLESVDLAAHGSVLYRVTAKR